MKKYLILLLIAGLALGLYLRNRGSAVKSGPMQAPSPVQETDMPLGVELPPGATDMRPYSVPQEAVSQAPQPSQALAQPAPNLMVLQSGDCVKKTVVKDVLVNYEKTWGYMHNDKLKSYAVMQSVGEKGIKDLSALVGKYQACVSLARDKDLCGSLPKAEGKAESEMARACVETLYPVGFTAYTKGKAAYFYCAGYFNNNLKGADKAITEQDFCNIAKGGLPAISQQFCGRVPAQLRSTCMGSFPKDQAGCKNEVCSMNWSVYSALQNNNPNYLGYDLRPLAAAILEKKESACQPLADGVVQSYCSVKSAIDNKVQELEINNGQEKLNKQMRSNRKAKSED